MSKFTSTLALAVLPATLLLPAAAGADPTNATHYSTLPVVCDSLGGVTFYSTANSPFGANKVEGTQLSLMLFELAFTDTVTATGEVLSHVVALERPGSVPVDETCSFSFEVDGVTTTVTGGFLVRGPSAE